MWKAVLAIAALAALGACSTTGAAPIVRHYPPAPYAQPPGADPNLYANAAFAPLHSELFVCNSYGSNLGGVGDRGQSSVYTPYMQTAAGSLMRNPTENACLSSGFGLRTSMGGVGREHTGLDLANAGGGFIYAAADALVTYAGWRGGYGNIVELDHGYGVRTLYAHLVEIDPRLQAGMSVPARAPIGRMGMTGNATGVHLHYEVSIDGLRVDPLHYGLAPPPIEEEPPLFEEESPVS